MEELIQNKNLTIKQLMSDKINPEKIEEDDEKTKNKIYIEHCRAILDNKKKQIYEKVARQMQKQKDSGPLLTQFYNTFQEELFLKNIRKDFDQQKGPETSQLHLLRKTNSKHRLWTDYSTRSIQSSELRTLPNTSTQQRLEGPPQATLGTSKSVVLGSQQLRLKHFLNSQASAEFDRSRVSNSLEYSGNKFAREKLCSSIEKNRPADQSTIMRYPRADNTVSDIVIKDFLVTNESQYLESPPKQAIQKMTSLEASLPKKTQSRMGSGKGS